MKPRQNATTCDHVALANGDLARSKLTEGRELEAIVYALLAIEARIEELTFETGRLPAE